MFFWTFFYCRSFFLRPTSLTNLTTQFVTRFLCEQSTISQDDLVAISETANRVITERHAVYTKEVPLAEVCKIRGLHTVNDTVSLLMLSQHVCHFSVVNPHL